MTLEQSFSRIQNWLTQNAPPLANVLRPPATIEQITQVERELDIIFPASVRQAYLLHDGESPESDGIFDLARWLSLGEVIQAHTAAKQIEAEYQFGDFQPGLMIPLFNVNGGFHYAESVAHPTDESPIIAWEHEQPKRDILYPSFAHRIATFAADLEADRYLYLPDEFNGLVHEDNW